MEKKCFCKQKMLQIKLNNQIMISSNKQRRNVLMAQMEDALTVHHFRRQSKLKLKNRSQKKVKKITVNMDLKESVSTVFQKKMKEKKNMLKKNPLVNVTMGQMPSVLIV